MNKLRLTFLAFFMALALSLQAQYDTASVRTYINTNIVTNGSKAITGAMMNYSFNASLNIAMKYADSVTRYVTAYQISAYKTKSQNDALYAALVHSHDFASITSKPTTKVGYGITDVVTYSDTANMLTTYAKFAHVVKYHDTSSMLTPYLRTVNLPSISGKVNYTDTAAMLAAYSRFGHVVKYYDTASMFSNYAKTNQHVKYADSVNMLLPYLRKIDTTTMLSYYARLGYVVMYGDTASMLSNYERTGFGVRYIDTSSMFANYAKTNQHVKYADTSNMLSPYARAANIASAFVMNQNGGNLSAQTAKFRINDTAQARFVRGDTVYAPIIRSAQYEATGDIQLINGSYRSHLQTSALTGDVILSLPNITGVLATLDNLSDSNLLKKVSTTTATLKAPMVNLSLTGSLQVAGINSTALVTASSISSPIIVGTDVNVSTVTASGNIVGNNITANNNLSVINNANIAGNLSVNDINSTGLFRVSSLTNRRIPFVSTAGLLKDTAGFTFGGNYLNVPSNIYTSGAGNGYYGQYVDIEDNAPNSIAIIYNQHATGGGMALQGGNNMTKPTLKLWGYLSSDSIANFSPAGIYFYRPLTATSFVGALTGNASTATLAANSSLLNGVASDINATNNTIVKRNSAGYIFGTYANFTSGASGLPLASITGKNNSSDNYYYDFTAAQLKTFAGYYTSGDNPTFGTGNFTGDVTITKTSPIINLAANSSGAAGLVLSNSGTNKWGVGKSFGSGDESFNIYNYTTSTRALKIDVSTNAFDLNGYSITAGAIAGTTGTFSGTVTAANFNSSASSGTSSLWDVKANDLQLIPKSQFSGTAMPLTFLATAGGGYSELVMKSNLTYDVDGGGKLNVTNIAASGNVTVTGSITAANIDAGEFTPTASAVVVGSVTPALHTTQRIGNNVTVYGTLSYTTPGTCPCGMYVDLTLPSNYATTLTTRTDVIGSGSGMYDFSTTPLTASTAYAFYNTSTSKVTVKMNTAVAAQTYTVNYSYSYKIK